MPADQAAIALNRFGLGARPGEIGRVSSDPRGWLIQQISPDPALPSAIAALPPTAESLGAFGKWIGSIGIGPAAGAGKLPAGVSVEQSFKRVLGPGYAQAAAARFQTATATDAPFRERWIRFWSNHFTVSAAKPDLIALPAAFERDVVRANPFGRFADMLLASTRHPAMLIYLDNYLSIGPDSELAHYPEVLPPFLRERMKGRNENLAREILELHTLGARGGYSQDDVIALANMLTGWTIAHGAYEGTASGELFRFLAFGHQPGAQTLLGVRYDQPGPAQGEAALRAIARHPSTAQHIAIQLARHFVADDPPPPLVARLAASFTRTGGDLAALAAALIAAPEAWSPVPRKTKPPEDYLISAVRALGAPQLTGGQLVALLTHMGQRPMAPPGPDGWPDNSAAWTGADALWKRIEWAATVAKATANASIDPAAIGIAVLGPLLRAETLAAVRAAESPAQGLALLLVSPEFQRR